MKQTNKQTNKQQKKIEYHLLAIEVCVTHLLMLLINRKSEKRHMWQSRVEIEHYFVVYFDCSVTHSYCVNMVSIHEFTHCV